MVLTTIAGRVHGQRSLTRTLIVVVAVATGIIFGLLAMHSMNTHAMASGHGDTVAVASSHPGTHHDLATADNNAPAAEAGCATCSDDQGVTWMACVLALLVALVLVARPVAWWRSLGQSAAALRSRPWLPTNGHPLRPPSLTVLCISRT